LPCGDICSNSSTRVEGQPQACVPFNSEQNRWRYGQYVIPRDPQAVARADHPADAPADDAGPHGHADAGSDADAHGDALPVRHADAGALGPPVVPADLGAVPDPDARALRDAHGRAHVRADLGAHAAALDAAHGGAHVRADGPPTVWKHVATTRVEGQFFSSASCNDDDASTDVTK